MTSVSELSSRSLSENQIRDALSLAPLVPDELVLEALALARRVNDRLKDRTPPATPRLRERPADEESYRPGELVC